MGREILLTFLSAAVLLLILLWLYGVLLRPIPGCGLVGLVPGRGSGEDLEGRVRVLVWLRSLGLLECGIVIADLGLDGPGLDLARRLALRWPEVVLWPADRIPELLRRTY